MFPIEKTAFTDVVAREMQQDILTNEGTKIHFLTESRLREIAHSTWNKAWQTLITFGSFSSGIIMIIIKAHMFKTIVDVIIRGYTLHAIFGTSIKILGAVFTSLTNMLIALQNKKQEEETTELQNIEIIKQNDESDEESLQNKNTTEIQKEPTRTSLRSFKAFSKHG